MGLPVRSGLITVTTAGTAVAGPAAPVGSLFGLKAHPDNTDTVWVGNDGADDVTSANGFPLDPGEGLAIAGEPGITLDQLYFDADVSGEKVCWILLKP